MILLNTISPWVIDIMIYGSIFAGLVILFLIFTAIYRAKKVINDYGVEPEPKNNFTETFWGMLIAAGVVIYLIKIGLEGGIGTLNTLFFSVFPYVAIAIFIIGSIYRYKNTGYKVSSLSSQFLEGKQLFWGSQPFHWGLMVLFFGHLIAFLFPKSIIIWNGMPVRLLILEVTSFVFGLSALLGLILLVKRRLNNKIIHVVSNKMDMLVYVTLLTQIISGLSVAYFVRWGSSWFAGVLTPYLRSLFAFSPKIDAVSAMPWLVQIHIISAFFIIAIIPFTRFMHFLVAPIDYLWRNYQLVIWNWNRKVIRTSTNYFPGKKIKNH